MKKILSYQEAYNWAARRCSEAECCAKDIEDKLQKKGTSPSVAKKVTEKLEEENFISVERYGRAFVLDKMRYSHWGRIKIGLSLKMKGFNSYEVSDAMENIQEEEYRDVLYSIIRSKNRSVKADERYERKVKLVRFALGRGFEMEQALKSVEEIINEEEDSEDSELY